MKDIRCGKLVEVHDAPAPPAVMLRRTDGRGWLPVLFMGVCRFVGPGDSVTLAEDEADRALSDHPGRFAVVNTAPRAILRAA